MFNITFFRDPDAEPLAKMLGITTAVYALFNDIRPKADYTGTRRFTAFGLEFECGGWDFFEPETAFFAGQVQVTEQWARTKCPKLFDYLDMLVEGTPYAGQAPANRVVQEM